jgi:hypothetical protein
MRVFVADRGPRENPPFEQLPDLMEQFQDWRERWRGKMESFEFFADGSGGFVVVNVDDEDELAQFMMEYPFGPFDEIDVQPIVDGDTWLPRWVDMAKQMAGGGA